jgi:hypothetical protein
MKNVITIAAALASLAALVSTAPTPNPLPEGFEPITHDEVMRILEARTNGTLEKRTPGGVCASTNASSHRGLLLK